MSPRARVRLVVGGIAVLAAALVVGITLVQSRGTGETAEAPGAEAAPLPRPFFYLDFRLPPDLAGLAPREQVEALRERADAGDVEALLVLGGAYQRAGRRDSARAAFDRALDLDPSDVRAGVAAAVVRFDPEAPAAAFSRLGPLARDHPQAAVVRYHLGLLLLWIRQADEARAQLEQALAADPGGFYGREARNLLARLSES
jgi:tetratricopeptide (TPR) repeat protein